MPYKNPKDLRSFQLRYIEANREKLKAEAKERRKRNKLVIAAKNRFDKFGLTDELFNRLWKTQNGRCAICKRPLSKVWRDRKKIDGACVDHNHVTNKLRGLLCVMCNRGLGLFRDSARLLEAAASYLNSSSTVNSCAVIRWKAAKQGVVLSHDKQWLIQPANLAITTTRHNAYTLQFKGKRFGQTHSTLLEAKRAAWKHAQTLIGDTAQIKDPYEEWETLKQASRKPRQGEQRAMLNAQDGEE